MTSNKTKRNPSRWKSSYTNPSRTSQEYSEPIILKKRISVNPTVAKTTSKPKPQPKPRVPKRKPLTERSRFKDCIIEYLRQNGKADKKNLTINQIRDRLLELRPEFRSVPRNRLISQAGGIIFDEILQKKMENPQVVYFVSYDEQLDYVKIGFTKTLRTRLSKFETSNWQNVVLRHLLYFSGSKTEFAYHKRFEQYRVRQGKEWFKVEGALKHFLSNKPIVSIETLANDPFIYQKFDESQPVLEGEGFII